MDFYIFRHGQSTYNLAGRTQGQTNASVLTDQGKEQARKVGQKLVGKGIGLLITSPLTRAVQTVNLANEYLKLPIVEDKRFIEVNVGEIEGLHYTEIQEKFGEKYQQWRSSSPLYEDIKFEGGETKRQVRERVFSGLNEYAENKSYAAIGISSHGIMLEQVLLSLNHNNVKVENCAVLHIENKNGQWLFRELF